jgi:predicted HTH domain antitoxin
MTSNATINPGDDTLATAIGRYVLGEISLGKAAEQAGLKRWEFEELLKDVGFTALYGPRLQEQLDDEINITLERE